MPSRPSSPNVVRNLALATLIGTLLGLGVALTRHLVDTRVRSGKDIAALTGTPLLGVIGLDKDMAKYPVIVREQRLSPTSEAIRRLHANLQFTDLSRRPRSIMVTSSTTGEGASTTSLNLAVALADAGSRVILVDADLRQPSVASSLGLEGSVGLTTVLAGRAELSEVVQPWEDTTLDILPSGRIPPNPRELLASSAMKRLLADLTARYDVVLVDSPPLLSFPDAAALSTLTGGSLLVVGADRVRRRQLRKAIASLTVAKGHLYGVVLNRAGRREAAHQGDGAGLTPASDVVKAGATSAASATSAVVAPKRARLEAPLPSANARVANQADSSGSRPTGQLNGSEPPSTRRATPVGS